MTADLGRPAYQGYLNQNCVTIAEVAKSAGYRTLMSASGTSAEVTTAGFATSGHPGMRHIRCLRNAGRHILRATRSR